VLVQASSGAGLEALQLGIPLIDLRFPGEPPNYPYLADSRIPSVAAADDLREAVAAARRSPPAEREELRAIAGGWVAAGGEAATRAGAAALERMVATGARESPVWDAWAPEPA
jgi:transglutaminase-like putative cysteine protease